MSKASGQKRSVCYLATPEHVRSFVGRFIYIYTDKGELSLTDTALAFMGSTGFPLEIPLHRIVGIGVGHYSRWAKPIRLDYMAIRHRDDEDVQTTLLTPTRSWSTPTWETNKIVAEWVGLVQDARAKAAERPYSPIKSLDDRFKDR